VRHVPESKSGYGDASGMPDQQLSMRIKTAVYAFP
jgi:hypothetical protein